MKQGSSWQGAQMKTSWHLHVKKPYPVHQFYSTNGIIYYLICKSQRPNIFFSQMFFISILKIKDLPCLDQSNLPLLFRILLVEHTIIFRLNCDLGDHQV